MAATATARSGHCDAPSPRETGAAVAAGLVAGAAFAAVLEADVRLTGRNVDDIAVLGRFFVSDQRRARLLGYGFHFANSVALALFYARLQWRLPGPPWARGVLFALAENALLYPVTVLQDRHPAIRDGSVDSYLTWPSFVQSLPRHIIYGAVLGCLFDRLQFSEPDHP